MYAKAPCAMLISYCDEHVLWAGRSWACVCMVGCGGGAVDKSGKVSTWAVTGRSIGLMHSLVGYDVFSQDSSPT